MGIKAGDRFVWHSKNGISYEVEVVNVNPYRPLDKEYAVDIYLADLSIKVNDDVLFVGDEFIRMCEAAG